jgi:hypothetical protein
MNAEFQFGYPPFDNSPDLESPTGQPRSREYLFGRLYVIADGKLNALLGYVGICNPGTKFLVYARGEPGLGWAEEGYRQQWVKNLERRFPALKGRVFTMNVEGGMEKGTFRDANTASEVRRIVRSILNLKPSDATQ